MESRNVKSMVNFYSYLSQNGGFEVPIRTYPSGGWTKAEVLAELTNESKDLKANDQLLLFIACHGKIGGVHYRSRSSFDDPNAILNYSEIAQALHGSAVGHLDLILDCCYSGSAFDSFETAYQDMPATHFNLITAAGKSSTAGPYQGQYITARFYMGSPKISIFINELTSAMSALNLDVNGDGIISPDEFDDQLVQAAMLAAVYTNNLESSDIDLYGGVQGLEGPQNPMIGTINGAVNFSNAPDPTNPALTSYPFANILFGEFGSYQALGATTAVPCLHSECTSGIEILTGNGPASILDTAPAPGIGYGQVVTYMWTNPPAYQYILTTTPQGGPVGTKPQ
jgi:hypothetical protein